MQLVSMHREIQGSRAMPTVCCEAAARGSVVLVGKGLRCVLVSQQRQWSVCKALNLHI